MLLLLILFSIQNSGIFQFKKDEPVPVRIEWLKSIQGDFSFIKKWQYSEGIYKNKFGQLVCDGLCPEETETMINEDGSIKKEFLNTYYKYVDTSHLKHSIQCEAWCYEWAGTDFIEVQDRGNDTVVCKTLMNAATHCSLIIIIAQQNAYATIELKGVVKNRNAVYYCNGGKIRIIKEMWDQGIVKGNFDFTFHHPENPEKKMYWRGKIYSKINSK